MTKEIIWQGNFSELQSKDSNPVVYSLQGCNDIVLNKLLGKQLTLRFTGRINCEICGRNVKKTFSRGLCYRCFKSRPNFDVCLFNPELCHFDNPDNPCRDEAWGREHCFAPHVLYLSLTSGLKVGITRQRNIPTRWIDQGAVVAMPLAIMPNRRDVGLVEKKLSSMGVKDKTHWARMLKGDVPEVDFDGKADELTALLEDWSVDGLVLRERRRKYTFTYPVLEYPKKVKSLDFAKTPKHTGILQGIKGQYLILDTGVVNVRKFAGYNVKISLHR